MLQKPSDCHSFLLKSLTLAIFLDPKQKPNLLQKLSLHAPKFMLQNLKSCFIVTSLLTGKVLNLNPLPFFYLLEIAALSDTKRNS